ncbi:MAG: lipopolysaccharide biosynthesis protein [Chloroflexi bacterium]|nr:lipopolysaccharide biosynthesis protein [Chloroflexota bacterium]
MSNPARPLTEHQPAALHALSLRANFAWTLAGNIVYAAAQWGVLVLLAKLASPEAVGQYALGLAITAPVMLFASMKLRALQATDVRHDYVFGHYFALRLVTTLAALAAIGTLAVIGDYRTELIVVIALIGLTRAFDNLSDIIYGLLQQRERMDRIAISQILQGGLQLLVFTVCLMVTQSTVWSMAGMAFASASITFAYDARSVVLLGGRWSALTPIWDWHRLGRLALRGIAPGLAITLGSLMVNIPRYVIEHRFDERELGMFAAVGAVALVGGTVVTALGQSASPRLAKHYAAGAWQAFDGLLLRLIGMGAALGAAGVAVTLVAGPQLLTLLYRPEYAERADVLVWMMMAYGLQFAYVFLGTAINAMRRFAVQLPVQIVSCLIVAGGSMVLIGPYGLVGVAWALLGANLFEAAAYAATVGYIRRVEPKAR